MKKVSITVEKVGRRTFVAEVGNLRVSAHGIEAALRATMALLSEEIFRSICDDHALIDEAREAHRKIYEETS